MSKRQSTFASLVISIQEDKGGMFTPLLLYSSIFPKDETGETVVLALESTLKEKGELLGKWVVL